MEVASRQLRRCDLITFKGRMDNASAPEVHVALDAILSAGRYKIAVDMQQVPTISSGSILELLHAQTTCKKHRGAVALAGVQPRVQEVFELAGLLPVFKLFDSPVEAVGSF